MGGALLLLEYGKNIGENYRGRDRPEHSLEGWLGERAKWKSGGGAFQGKVLQEPTLATVWHVKGKRSGYSGGGGLEITGKGCQKGLWTKSEALGDGPRIWARALDSHK